MKHGKSITAVEDAGLARGWRGAGRGGGRMHLGKRRSWWWGGDMVLHNACQGRQFSARITQRVGHKAQMYNQRRRGQSVASALGAFAPYTGGAVVMASSSVFDGVRPPNPLAPILWPDEPHSNVAGADAAYWKFCCLLAADGGSNIESPPTSSLLSPVVSSSGDSPIDSIE